MAGTVSACIAVGIGNMGSRLAVILNAGSDTRKGMRDTLHFTMKNIYYLYSYEFLLLAWKRLCCTHFPLNSYSHDVKQKIPRSVVSGILILDNFIFALVVPARQEAVVPTGRPVEVWGQHRVRKRIINSVY